MASGNEEFGQPKEEVERVNDLPTPEVDSSSQKWSLPKREQQIEHKPILLTSHRRRAKAESCMEPAIGNDASSPSSSSSSSFSSSSSSSLPRLRGLGDSRTLTPQPYRGSHEASSSLPHSPNRSSLNSIRPCPTQEEGNFFPSSFDRDFNPKDMHSTFRPSFNFTLSSFDDQRENSPIEKDRLSMSSKATSSKLARMSSPFGGGRVRLDDSDRSPILSSSMAGWLKNRRNKKVSSSPLFSYFFFSFIHFFLFGNLSEDFSFSLFGKERNEFLHISLALEAIAIGSLRKSVEKKDEMAVEKNNEIRIVVKGVRYFLFSN